ncbi:MAG: hypothetical protein IT582_00060 [Opitutaceae bacterium]|nr:hypothetical protein [Opitutaceae bacterium]
MRRLPQSEIYTSTDCCLAFARTLPPSSPRPLTPVHFFWQGRAFGAKAALCLRSFLATQDPRRFQAWLWLEDETAFAQAERNPWLGSLLPHVKLLRYDWPELSRDTPLANRPWTQSLAPAARSDLARLVCLARHGGCYSDLDALFLRDLGPLLDLAGDAEFCFQWGAVARGTNAFCRHRAAGTMIEALMRRADAAQSAHPTNLLEFSIAPEELLLLPVGLFSPLWLHDDGHERCGPAPYRHFAGFYRKFGWFHRRPATPVTLDSFFPGAFTYHWHGLWGMKEHTDSYASLLDHDCRGRLASFDSLPAFGTRLPY